MGMQSNNYNYNWPFRQRKSAQPTYLARRFRFRFQANCLSFGSGQIGVTWSFIHCRVLGTSYRAPHPSQMARSEIELNCRAGGCPIRISAALQRRRTRLCGRGDSYSQYRLGLYGCARYAHLVRSKVPDGDSERARKQGSKEASKQRKDQALEEKTKGGDRMRNLSVGSFAIIYASGSKRVSDDGRPPRPFVFQ